MTDLVALIRQYAWDHYYVESWDIVARSWSDAEIADAIRGAKTRRGAIAKAWGKLQVIDRARPDYDRPRKPASLFAFLASRGGLQPNSDLHYILDGNPLVPQHGPLIRKSGMTLDRAREAAVEAGYLHCDGFNTDRLATSTTIDLLNAIEDEARGTKRYPLHEAPPVQADERVYEEEEACDDIPF